METKQECPFTGSCAIWHPGVHWPCCTWPLAKLLCSGDQDYQWVTVSSKHHLLSIGWHLTPHFLTKVQMLPHFLTKKIIDLRICTTLLMWSSGYWEKTSGHLRRIIFHLTKMKSTTFGLPVFLEQIIPCRFWMQCFLNAVLPKRRRRAS